MSSQTEQHFYEFGPFRVDTLKRLLLRDGQTVPLTAKAFDTLLTFVQHSGQDLDKDELMRTVWPDTIVEENNLTQNVSALRKALGESKSEHRYIVTIPGRGYRFVASVREVCDAELLRGEAETLGRGEGIKTSGNGAAAANAAPEHLNESLISELNEATLPAFSPHHRVAAPPRLDSSRARASRLRIIVIVLLSVGLIAALSYGWYRNRPQPEQRVSIAVLPFMPLETAVGYDSLGLSMAHDLIIKLRNIKQISVRPTSAVSTFGEGGSRIDPVAAGRELNVDWVLEGKIQKVNDRVRGTVRLINVREGLQRWITSFDEPQASINTLQDSISAQVTEKLSVAPTSEEEEQMKKRYTENIEANEFYMLGRYLWNKRDEENLNKSIVHFNKAIERDPSYALAYAGLADAYSVIGFYQFGKESPEVSYQKAKEAALKAIALDNKLAEAHASLALARGDVDNDEAAAELEYNRAIELDPEYATAHHWYSDFLAMTGRPAKAMDEIKLALKHDPVSLVIKATLGERFYQERRYSEAIEQLRHTLEKDRNFGPAHYLLGLALEQAGNYDEAILELKEALRLSGQNPWMVSALGHTLARSGQRDEARRVLEELHTLKKSRYVTPYDFAVVYQGLGQPEQVIEELQKMDKNKVKRLLKIDPRMDTLQQDPRFQKLYGS